MEDPHQLSEEMFEELRALFTPEDLATLCAYIGFISGATRFGVIAGLSEQDKKG